MVVKWKNQSAKVDKGLMRFWILANCLTHVPWSTWLRLHPTSR